jgi:hypothetical protein
LELKGGAGYLGQPGVKAMAFIDQAGGVDMCAQWMRGENEGRGTALGRGPAAGDVKMVGSDVIYCTALVYKQRFRTRLAPISN